MGTLRRPVVAGVVACLLLGLGGAGCSERGGGLDLAGLTQPPGPLPAPAPIPNSPVGVLRLAQWSYDNRSLAYYGDLFSEDFRGSCSPLDSAGGPWRETGWTRSDEIISTSNLFFGGSVDQPAAIDVRLRFDSNLFVYPDPSCAAWDPLGRWHRIIRTTHALSVVTSGRTGFEIFGHGSFYCVRGDSAAIPEELRLRGFRPDSTRWYIRGWEDETAQPDGGAGASRSRKVTSGPTRPAPLDAQPSGNTSWCALKLVYR